MRQGRLYLGTLYAPERTGDGREWMLDAACTQVDPEIFFPEVGKSSKQAKAICSGCDVRELCLEYALATDNGKHHYGVFGGKSVRERRAIAKQRGLKEENDDEFAEPYRGREGESDWEMESLLSEEEEDDWGDLQFIQSA